MFLCVLYIDPGRVSTPIYHFFFIIIVIYYVDCSHLFCTTF